MFGKLFKKIKKRNAVLILCAICLVVILAVVYGKEVFLRNEKNDLQRIMITDKNNIYIKYRTDNGSLPPPYHKEETITITTDKSGSASGTYIAKDYKKVTADKQISLTPEQLTALIKAVNKVTSGNGVSLFGCTGGTNGSIEIRQNGRKLLNTDVYNCADESTNPSLEKFFEEVGQIIPQQ